ncbi:MAG: HAD family hydrolase [Thermoplasmatales archaeon]
MRKNKGMFLDFSNTITTVESENLSIKAWLSFITEKYHLTGDVYEKFVKRRLEKLVEREKKFETFMEINREVLKELYGIEDIFEDDYYKFHEKYLRLRPDFLNFFDAIRNEFVTVVVTDADDIYTKRTMSSLGIYEIFDFIVTAEDVKAPKPDSRIFQEALRKAGNPEILIYIGDSERRDIKGAKKMGFIVIKMEDHSGETVADYVVHNFTEVLGILKKEKIIK